MVDAAAKVLGTKWKKARAFAEPEFTKIAQTIATIQASRLAGSLSEAQARLLLDMQRNASRSVLLAVEVVGVVAAEEAINGALAVVRKAVNRAVGFTLIA
jgi:hypothetical protein